MSKMTFEFNNPMLYDKLRILADEYSVSMELLVNVAVKRLIDDVQMLYSIRAGTFDLESYCSLFSK